MSRMTKSQMAVLQYLIQPGKGFVSPTKIGYDVGGGRRHSAWASPICKRLVEKGFVVRNERGWYAAATIAKGE